MLLYALLGCVRPPPLDLPARDLPDLEVARRPRDVLMISVDTFRRAAIGRYGGGGDTPFLDGLAERSVALDRHQTCSAWTYPAVTCALTGRLPYDLGILPNLQDPSDEMAPLPAGTGTIAGHLGGAGWQSLLVSTNRHIGPMHNTAEGYGAVEDWKAHPAGAIVDRGLEWLRGPERDRDRRWLLHLHFMDAHEIYEPPARYRDLLAGRPALPWDLSTWEGLTAFEEAEAGLDAELREEARAQMRLLYRGEVRYLDDEIRRLIETAEAEGLLSDALIVFWNDHGEQFWEHGERGHNKSLYAEENDGFLWFSGSDVVPVAWEDGTGSVDLLPTLLGFLGQKIPGGLRGVQLGEAEPERARISVFWPPDEPPMQSVTIAETKLIYSWDGRHEAYRRGQDPGEQVDIYDRQDPIQAAEWEIIRAEAERMEPFVDGYRPHGIPR